ncbi:TetR family transcriptional regulator [Nonomuraea deserti]|uniref:TetR family transcriptional regulator n=1 Tax=Nonomuraea deserti TaxID=1848322 RepID=A0A4R4UC62_9ACTN|nr:TetR family transcriptional regulator [Nonomuraea deserti]
MAALGPLLGGWVVTDFGWRWAFWVNLPIPGGTPPPSRPPPTPPAGSPSSPGSCCSRASAPRCCCPILEARVARRSESGAEDQRGDGGRPSGGPARGPAGGRHGDPGGRGFARLTPAAVGARVGLARSSVYRYFSSTSDILAQLVEDAIPRWTARLESAVSRASGLEKQVRAFGEVTMSFVTSPDYALLRALASVDLPPACQERLDRLHETMIAPLRDVLADAGHDQPDLVAHLGWSILGEAQRRIAAGADAGPITATTLAVLCRALLPPAP